MAQQGISQWENIYDVFFHTPTQPSAAIDENFVNDIFIPVLL